jgi:hypothetical protein
MVSVMVVASVVVNYFNFGRARTGPFEADPPLIVDADAMLAGPVALQLFQPVTGGNSEVVEIYGGVEDEEFSKGDTGCDGVELSNASTTPDRLGVLVRERPQHCRIVTHLVNNVKR